MNILDQLAEYSRLRVAEDKEKISLDEIKNIAIQTKNEKLCDFAFEKALKKDGLFSAASLSLQNPCWHSAHTRMSPENSCYMTLSLRF